MPDTLCSECLAIFVRDITWHEYSLNVINVLPNNPSECKLCALLIDRLIKDAQSSEALRAEYILCYREGYFDGVYDILFRRTGSTSWETNIVRLAIQEAAETGEIKISSSRYIG